MGNQVQRNKIYSNQFKQYIWDETNAQKVVYLHTGPPGLSTGGIVLELIPEVSKLFGWPADICSSLEVQIKKYSKYGGANSLMNQVALLLKNKGVFSRMPASTVINQKKSLMESYGVLNPGQLKEQREKLSERNKADVYKVSFSEEYLSFRKEVDKLTSRVKKRWRRKGDHDPVVDYYTGLPFLQEMISTDLMQGDLYPTIDHKLSIYYCYINNISPAICASEENLCWTFRYLNGRKNDLPEHIFITHVLPLYKLKMQEEIQLLISQGFAPCEYAK